MKFRERLQQIFENSNICVTSCFHKCCINTAAGTWPLCTVQISHLFGLCCSTVIFCTLKLHSKVGFTKLNQDLTQRNLGDYLSSQSPHFCIHPLVMRKAVWTLNVLIPVLLASTWGKLCLKMRQKYILGITDRADKSISSCWYFWMRNLFICSSLAVIHVDVFLPPLPSARHHLHQHTSNRNQINRI